MPSIAPPYSGQQQGGEGEEEQEEGGEREGASRRNARFLHAMFALPEERGREVLGAALAELLEGGQEAPNKRKKRGLGAEMLGLVTAATAPPRRREEEEGGGCGGAEDAFAYDPAVVGAHAGLLAWALAVVEAMQRSSDKQLTAHLLRTGGAPPPPATPPAPVTVTVAAPPASPVVVGRASFELRGQRERAVLSRLLQSHRGEGCVSASAVVKIIMEECALQPPPPSPRQGDDEEGEEEVVVKDIKHSLLLTARWVTTPHHLHHSFDHSSLKYIII
jgi:hypothetical protein